MASDTNADELLQTLGREVMKIHRVYDENNRVTAQYETVANAADGAPALKTTYAYDGDTSRVTDMKEEIDAWDSDWDI